MRWRFDGNVSAFNDTMKRDRGGMAQLIALDSIDDEKAVTPAGWDAAAEQALEGHVMPASLFKAIGVSREG